MTTSRADASVDEALPGYEVSGELGRGAMGEVLAGRHVRLERSVAIKRLPSVFADDPEVRARFAAEAKVLASLNHPHVVPVYDYVEERGLCLLVMQALPGGTVWDRFSAEGLSMPAACAVVVATCAGLQHAHNKKVLHRDVKPENLMFDDERVLKVTDFGIATAIGGDETLATLDGKVIGTPAYMAPEQAEGRQAGPQADVYAAGTMLYELLSGRLPFADDGDGMSLLRQRLAGDPTPLDQVAPVVPAPLVEAVMTAIQRRPEDRYATAEQFGIAVAGAASSSWGPEWLEHTELPLLSGGAISSAARTTARPVADAGSPQSRATASPVRPESIEPAPATRVRHTDGRTGAPGEEGPGPASQTQVRRPDARPAERGSGGDASGTVIRDAGGTGAGASARVRPTVSRRPAPVDLAEVDERDLVPISDVLTPPASPRPQLAVLALLLLGLAWVAFVGFGADASTEPLAEGRILVAGQDLATTDRVAADLAEPVEIRIGAGAEDATLVSIDTAVAGLPAGSSSIEELEDTPGGRSAAVTVSSLRRVTSGAVPAELRVTDEFGEPVLTRRFTLEQQQLQLLNGAVVTAAVVTLFVAVYLASITRPLRLGRRRRSAYPGLALVGAFGGIAVDLWGWALAGPAPRSASLVVSALLGAVAAPLAGWCLFLLGRRRRLRRADAT